MDTLFKHLKRQKGYLFPTPQFLDPTTGRLNPSGFHVWSPRLKCWRSTSKSLGIIIGAKSHRFLFARLVGLLSCRTCIATSRPVTGRLCWTRPTPCTCRCRNANTIRSWRSFIISANIGGRDPDPGKKTVLSFILQGIIEGHCDLDLFLDRFFMHLPSPIEMRPWYPGLRDPQKNIPNLISALTRLDSSEPWRIQFRSRIEDHPRSSIARLSGKSFSK